MVTFMKRLEGGSIYISDSKKNNEKVFTKDFFDFKF